MAAKLNPSSLTGHQKTMRAKALCAEKSQCLDLLTCNDWGGVGRCVMDASIASILSNPDLFQAFGCTVDQHLGCARPDIFNTSCFLAP